MSIFSFSEGNQIGEVVSVDTAKVEVGISNPDRIVLARVGRLVTVQGNNANEWLLGMINRVWRDQSGTLTNDPETNEPILTNLEKNSIQITLLGTYRAKHGARSNYFTRALLSLPDIDRPVYPVEGSLLETFMGIINTINIEDSSSSLEIGSYTLDTDAKAFLDGDKLFQRHAALLGSTGSGKSWAVANLLEQSSKLDCVNIVVFDLHGEYKKLPYAQQFRIAGPGDLKAPDESVLFLPFWLLNYEEMQTMFVDHSEQSAPNQSMAILEAITKAKKETLVKEKQTEVLELFTVDSPIPFKIQQIIEELEGKNVEEIGTGENYVQGDKKGQEKTVQGPLYNKLTRLLIRLTNKIEDRRYGFLFQAPDEWNNYDALYKLVLNLMGDKSIKGYKNSGIKVIDFSEVPSDILPVIVSLIARLIYQVQVWTDPGEDNDNRHPIVLLCDEAHIYLPSKMSQGNSIERRALENFERIAKEGRKYGVGLMVVSQRPSDVSTTILSQCNNIISLRLSNDADKSVVKSLLPESLGGLLDVLPSLEVGESIVVGDSVLLPMRIKLHEPKHPPVSSTMDFWRCWGKKKGKNDLSKAVESLRRQSRII